MISKQEKSVILSTHTVYNVGIIKAFKLRNYYNHHKFSADF